MTTNVTIGDVVRNDLVQYEALSVMNFRTLDTMNVREFVPPRPGVYALAHTAAHDELHVEPPYHYGTADNLFEALQAHLAETEPALAKHQQRGSRWFCTVAAEPAQQEATLAGMQARFTRGAEEH